MPIEKINELPVFARGIHSVVESWPEYEQIKSIIAAKEPGMWKIEFSEDQLRSGGRDPLGAMRRIVLRLMQEKRLGGFVAKRQACLYIVVGSKDADKQSA